VSESPWRTVKGFREELGYSESTMTRWLPGLRDAGAAVGYGHATRINVPAALAWITAKTAPAVERVVLVVQGEMVQ
jgi:hypothetical protein